MSLLGPLLLGSGLLRDDLRSQLAQEGLLLIDEELPGSVALHHRANGRRASSEFRATSGAIAVTRRRLLVWSEGRVQIDVPPTHERLRAIEISADGSERVLFAFDLERLRANGGGRMEIRLRTPQAARIVALLESAK